MREGGREGGMGEGDGRGIERQRAGNYNDAYPCLVR